MNYFVAKLGNGNQIEKEIANAGGNKKYFKEVSKDDCLFLKTNEKSIKSIAIASEEPHMENGDWVMRFKRIVDFINPIPMNKFISFKFLKVDRLLLNGINGRAQGGFFKIEIIDDIFKAKIDNIINDNTKKEESKKWLNDYVENDSNCRKILILKSQNDFEKNSEDIQIAKENDKFYLYSSNFLDKKTIINYFSGSNYANGKYKKLYNLIEEGKTEIKYNDATTALTAFYNLFAQKNTYKNKVSKKHSDNEGFFNYYVNVQGSTPQYANDSITRLKDVEKALNIKIDDYITSIEKREELIKKMDTIPNDVISNTKVSHTKSNFKVYYEYKNQKKESNTKEPMIKQEELIANIKEYLHKNTIFYGVPGCGKSYKIKELLIYEKMDEKGNHIKLDEKYYKRILFHPEYSYSDFVGQIMPKTNADKTIEYSFRPGPFAEILKDALEDKHEDNYFLIIEEINRGNAPSIFGDVFQLLDRDEDGKSEYPIYNKELSDWLNNESKEIRIPHNLTILATMNTCDQNVFTLDTAFKRRWRMTRIENAIEKRKDDIEIINCKLSYKWKAFAIALNKDILKCCGGDGTLAEDKQLGAYFVKGDKENKIDVREFAEKIFMYLWNDVVKYNKEQLFKKDYKTLDKVIDVFCNGENVFNENCKALNDLYKEPNEDADKPTTEEGNDVEVTSKEETTE